VVNAADTMNETLFLTHLESTKMKVHKEFREDKDLSGITAHKAFIKTFSRLLEREASAVKKALDDHPWAGKVLSVKGQKVMITAGKDVGAAPGDIFEVFGRGEPLRTVGGTHLFVRGPKLGEVRVTEVMGDYSVAVPVNAAKFQAGQIIRLKR
jgi:hypothetical protein